MMFEIHLGRVCLSRRLIARRRLKAGQFVANCFLIVSELPNFFRFQTNNGARRESKIVYRRESKIVEMFVLFHIFPASITRTRSSCRCSPSRSSALHRWGLMVDGHKKVTIFL